MKKWLSATLAMVILVATLSGCTNRNTETDSTHIGVSENTAGSTETGSSLTDSDMFTDRDYETGFDEDTSVLIQLEGNSAKASSDSVQISGTSITITEEATYLISGTLNDGMIIVNAPDTAKLQLVFNGVNITSATSAALYVLEADKVFITLPQGTENSLSNGGTFTAIDENNIDGALFSKQDLTLNGSGSLTVTSPTGHGIVCKDDLVITGGTYMQIKNGTFQIVAGGGSENGSQESSGFWGGFRDSRGPGAVMEPASTTSDSSTSMKGIKSTGSLTIANGYFTIDSADDSIHSNASITVNGGTFEIASGDDAFHADETLSVTTGVINITESYEGLEALDIDIQNGEITLTATDDGLNAAGGTDYSGTVGGRDGMFGGGGMHEGMYSSSNGSITISGGTLKINASGDGIDANGSIEISGGYVTVVGPTQGDTATLDYDTSAVITGGTFIGTGASGMAQTFSDSKQGVIAVSIGNQAAGTAIAVTDTTGNTLITFTPELSFNVIIFSSPDIVSGNTYTVTAGSITGEVKAN